MALTPVLDSDLPYGDTAYGSFLPSQVFYTGPYKSSAAMVATGQVLAKYTVVGLNASGEMVPIDSAALAADIDAKATGTLTFAANPAPADTLTLNGVVITFVASGAAANQVNIGATPALTAQAVRTLINAAAPATYAMTATGGSNVLTLTAIAAGTGGNALTIAKSGANPALSGATLAGGDAGGETDPAPQSKPYGVLAQPIDTTGGAASCPVFTEGTFVHDAIVWPADIDTLAKRRTVCNGSMIAVDALKG